MKFHNGNPFSADDVVASLKRASDPNFPYLTATSQIQDVKKVDDLTADVILKGEYLHVLNDLAGVGIMNKAWISRRTSPAGHPTERRGELRHCERQRHRPVYASRAGDLMPRQSIPHGGTKPLTTSTRSFSVLPLDATRTAAFLSGELDLITRTYKTSTT